MNEIDFCNFLVKNGVGKKIISDHISRLKRLERSIEHCDIDEEYDKDKCNYLLSLLSSKNDNEKLKKVLIAPMPIGSYAMNTFKYSIRKYIEFRNSLK